MLRSVAQGRKRRVAPIGALGLWLLLPLAAGAATFPDLYTVTVVTGAGSGDRRAEAERLGMSQLLMRVTGRRDASSNPELAPLIENAQSYVNSWGPLDSEHYTVGFNASRVTGELTRLNWPVWGAERPLTLLWIAVDFGNGQRGLVGESLADAELPPEIGNFMESLRTELDRLRASGACPSCIRCSISPIVRSSASPRSGAGSTASSRARRSATTPTPSSSADRRDRLWARRALDAAPGRPQPGTARHDGSRGHRLARRPVCGRVQHRRRRAHGQNRRARRRFAGRVRPRHEPPRVAQRAAQRRCRRLRRHDAESARRGARRRPSHRARLDARRAAGSGRGRQAPAPSRPRPRPRARCLSFRRRRPEP